MQSNVQRQRCLRHPKNEEERAFVAGACVRKLGIKFPAVLDEFGNSTEQAYTGWPDRIYLIDQNGRVAFKTKPGPFGFKPDDLAAGVGPCSPQVNIGPLAAFGKECGQLQGSVVFLYYFSQLP